MGGWEVNSDDFFIPNLNHFNTESVKTSYIFSSSLAIGEEKNLSLLMVWGAQLPRSGTGWVGLLMLSCLYQQADDFMHFCVYNEY